MQAAELLQRINSKNPPLIVDPRSTIEFGHGHIPGAINAPVGKLLLGMTPLPEDRNTEMVIACMHGQRAWIARKLLGLRGYRTMDFLDGWIEGWIKAGLPVEK